jgi:ribonuclease P protein component
MRREHRLTRSADFERTTRAGKRWAGDLVVVYHLPGAGPTRVGLAVGRRIGTAVVRNRVRRRLREAVRPLLPHLAGGDLVVVARAGAERAEVADLARSIAALAETAGLLAGGDPLHNRGTTPNT